MYLNSRSVQLVLSQLCLFTLQAVCSQCISQQETDFEWRREGISKAGKTIAGNWHSHVSLYVYEYVYKIFCNQKRENISGLQPLDQQFIMNHFGWAELAFNHQNLCRGYG